MQSTLVYLSLVKGSITHKLNFKSTAPRCTSYLLDFAKIHTAGVVRAGARLFIRCRDKQFPVRILPVPTNFPWHTRVSIQLLMQIDDWLGFFPLETRIPRSQVISLSLGCFLCVFVHLPETRFISVVF